MQTLICSEILEAVKGILISGDNNLNLTNISTDSRRISEGDLFIPIAGEKFDGHDFIIAALNTGAEAVFTHKDIPAIKGKTIIKVEDTLKALGDLAAYYRQKFRIPFVGVTGSVGKTSTKDMIASVFSQKYNVLKTGGNFNNEIGLPLTIFNLDSFHEAGIIEMGMSGLGEIGRLTSITKPNIAVITNIGTSHIEKLGSRQNILKAKMEILDGLNRDGLVVLNGDDKLLFGMKDLLKFRTVFYGIGEGLDYQAYNLKSLGEKGISFDIMIKNHEYKIHIPAPGTHNVYNALAAIASGLELDIPMDKIIRGIKDFTPSQMRLNITNINEFKVINDVYNASPQSMEAAINVLKDVANDERSIAVLGDMLELGEWSTSLHREVGKYAVLKGIKYIITVGKNGGEIASGAIESEVKKDNVFSFKNNEEVNEFLSAFVKSGDIILVKGSRGMKMEQIVEHLKTIDRIR